MASKIFDGVTDLFAGWIVDNTHTKLGKGRPYELCLIGVWVCMYALFATGTDWSMTMKCVWIFIMYTLIFSIFSTMLNAAETPYEVWPDSGILNCQAILDEKGERCHEGD